MKYDINLKKTQLGYQFDRNVFIGYQTNDNRVVTVKELKGYIGGSGGGGGGGGGGGIQSITLTGDPSNGQITLTVDDEETTVSATNVVAAPSTSAPGNAKVCVIAQSGDEFVVYPTDKTWTQLLDSIPSIAWDGSSGNNLFQITVGEEVHTLALALGGGLSKSANNNTTTLSIDNSVVRGLSITNSGLSYTDGNGSHNLSGVIGTTPVTTLSIATKTSTTPSDDSVVTVGYLNTQYKGGNVYYTENDPTADPPSDMDQTKFIFVEVE